jgi:hypothetical protein
LAWKAPRIKLWWGMAVVAVVAVGLRFLDLLILAWPLVAAVPLIVLAGRSRHRATIAAAFCVVYPFLIPVALVLTWLTAWAALGHRPRVWIDDPKDEGLVAAPYVLTLWLMLWTPVVATATLLLILKTLVSQQGYRTRVLSVLFLAPVAWYVTFYHVLKALNPILVWFRD